MWSQDRYSMGWSKCLGRKWFSGTYWLEVCAIFIMLLLDVAMKHNSVYILLADTYDFFFIKVSSNVAILTLPTFIYYWNEFHFWLGHTTVKVQWGEPPWFFTPIRYLSSRTSALKDSTVRKKERSEVYSVISAMNWSKIKLGDSVTWNASDRIFGDSTIENKFLREEWQPCFEFT